MDQLLILLLFLAFLIQLIILIQQLYLIKSINISFEEIKKLKTKQE